MTPTVVGPSIQIRRNSKSTKTPFNWNENLRKSNIAVSLFHYRHATGFIYTEETDGNSRISETRNVAENQSRVVYLFLSRTSKQD